MIHSKGRQPGRVEFSYRVVVDLKWRLQYNKFFCKTWSRRSSRGWKIANMYWELRRYRTEVLEKEIRTQREWERDRESDVGCRHQDAFFLILALKELSVFSILIWGGILFHRSISHRHLATGCDPYKWVS